MQIHVIQCAGQSVSARCPPANELKLGLHPFRIILGSLDSHTHGQKARQPDGKDKQSDEGYDPSPCCQQPPEDGRPVPLATCTQLMDCWHQRPDHPFAQQCLFVGMLAAWPGENKRYVTSSSNGLRTAWSRVAWNKLRTIIIGRGGVLYCANPDGLVVVGVSESEGG